MNYKVLYRKYRPEDFDNLIGQEYTVEILKNILKSKHIGHAYIFSGPRGTGKTSAAKLFAKALNCENPQDGNPCNECFSCKNFNNNPDIIEIDAASNNGVDQIRELINNVKIAPSYSKFKVYIIDEVHMLTTNAFNALLLTLEEPPKNIVFILATTDIQNVPITILSRCQRFNFNKIASKVIFDRIKKICDLEKIKITDEAIRELSMLSDGGLRDALSMLDQISSINKEKIEIDDIVNFFGLVSNEHIRLLIDYILRNDTEAIVNTINNIKKSGTNYSNFIKKLVKEMTLKAIEADKNENYLDYSLLKNMVLELSYEYNNLPPNIDPYDIITLNLISDKAKTAINEASKPKEQKKEDLAITETIRMVTSVDEDSFIKSNEFVAKRVNNCYIEASKDSKHNFQNIWKEFISQLKIGDKKLYGMLKDSEVCMASLTHTIISQKMIEAVVYLNQNVANIEKNLKKSTNNVIKLAFVTNEEWQSLVNKFKADKKKNIIYKLEENDDPIKNNAKIKGIAETIFGDSIEIKEKL